MLNRLAGGVATSIPLHGMPKTPILFLPVSLNARWRLVQFGIGPTCGQRRMHETQRLRQCRGMAFSGACAASDDACTAQVEVQGAFSPVNRFAFRIGKTANAFGTGSKKHTRKQAFGRDRCLRFAIIVAS